MNLLGISWGMGARDVGMKAAVTSAQNNVEKLNDSMEAQSKIAQKSKVPGFFASLREGFKEFNIAAIAKSMQDLTGDTGNLSNSIESMGVANAKVAKPFVASMNLTGKEAKRMTSRISGMAIGMNVGAESVAKVFQEFNRMTPEAKKTMKALGMTEKDLVKFTETSGVSAEDLNATVTDLAGAWEMAPEKIALFLNSMTELGKKTGVGMVPIRGMKDNLQALDNAFEKLPPGMQRTGEEITALMESSVRLSGAFAAQGATQGEAAKMGADTAKMFADQSVAIQRGMQLGLSGGDLGDQAPVLKYLTGLGLRFDEALKVIDVGSRDAVAGMQMVQQAFSKSGSSSAQADAMLAELSRTMGDSVEGMGWLAQAGDEGAKSLKRMSDISVTGKDTLKKFGDEAFSTGRNLQESLDLMKASFETRFRRIARKDVVKFVGEMGKAYDSVAKKTKALASDETWGPIVKRFSAMDQLGAKGLFMNLDGKSNKKMAEFSAVVGLGGSALNNLATSAGPAVALVAQLVIVMGPITKLFGGFLGKLGLVGIAVGAVAVGLKMLSGRGMDLSGVFAKVVKWLSGVAGKVKNFLAGIDWAEVGKKLGGFIWDVLTFIPKTIWNWLTGKESKTELGQAGEGFIKNLGGAIMEAAKGLGKMLWNLGGEIIDGISEWWDSWTWEDVKTGFESMGNNIKQWWQDVQKDPEFREFALDLDEGLEDAGWAIQDWFSGLGDKFDSGTAKLADSMNMEGSGEQAGASFATGIATGIRSATAVSEVVKQQSVEALRGATEAAREFDPADLDDAYATTTAHWIVRAKDLSTGVANTITGFFAGAVDQSGKESNVSISTFFSNMFQTAKNEVYAGAQKFLLSLKEVGAFLADTWDLIMHPEKLEKREKALAARRAKEQSDDMQKRLANVQGDVKTRKKIYEDMQASYKDQSKYSMEAFKIGQETIDPNTGKVKKKKQAASESKWMTDTWTKQADKISLAAQAQTSAQSKVNKLQASLDAKQPGDVLPGDIAALNKAKIDLSVAQSGLAGVQEATMASAKKAGIKGDALSKGVGDAMKLILTMEEARVAAKEAMATAQERLAGVEAQAQDASTKATAAVAATFDKAATDATNAGAKTATNFASGLSGEKAVAEIATGADKAVKAATDQLPGTSALDDFSKSMTAWGISVKNEFQWAAEHLKEFGSALGRHIGEGIRILSETKKSISEWGVSVGLAFASTQQSISKWGTETGISIGGAFVSGVKSVQEWGLSIGTALGTGTKSISEWGATTGTTIWEKFSIENLKLGVQTYLIDPFKTAIQAIPEALASVFDGLGDFFSKLDPQKLAKPIADFLQRAWEKIKGIGGGVADFFSGIFSWGQEAASGIGAGVAAGMAGQQPPAPKPIAPVAAPFTDVAGDTSEAGLAAGMDFAAGLSSDQSVAAMTTAGKTATTAVSDQMTLGSPIPLGPLAGVGGKDENDPAYMAGRKMMEMLAAGITSGTSMVYDAVTDALNESVLASMDAYSTEMKKIAEKKSLLNEVAVMLMRDFGSKMESTVEVGGKTENVKETMEAMLSVPGIAGVTMAIINESAKQRAILDKIRVATEKTASTVRGEGKEAHLYTLPS